MRTKLEIVGLVAGILGLVGVIIVTALPNWKVTAYIGADIIVMETLWEGLWMNCQKQSIFRMQCKVYDSVLILPPDMQAARGLMCCSIILALFAVLMSGCGMQSSNCCQEDPRKKSHVVLVGGCIFLLSGLTTLIPICWTANTIIRDFYNPLLVDAQKRELGEALYTGWATAGLLAVAGIILIWCSCQHSEKDEEKPGSDYTVVKSSEKLSRVHSRSAYV
ncbi:claudin-4-like [Paramormyrops kingsleyae]|uniref:claudin-4-like n=1 Tax=Paramormyrops kingsleyae TaxID=1676925 RepID=UPI003B97806A